MHYYIYENIDNRKGYLRRKSYLIRIFVFLFIFILFFSFLSCFPQSLKGKRIKSFSIDLADCNFFNKKVVDKVVPESSYILEFFILLEDGKKITHPFSQDIILSSPNGTFTFEVNPLNQIYCYSTSDYLSLAEGNLFTIELSTIYEPEKKYYFEFLVDWYNLKDFEFKGKDGYDGTDGRDGHNGKDGTESSPAGTDGEDGTDGYNGGDGENGRSINMDIAMYKADNITGYYEDYFLILYEKITKKIYVRPVNNFTVIDTSGGNGGDGGSPGKGGYGGKGYNGAPNGKKGADGKAGNPGRGGNAGNIFIHKPIGMPLEKYVKLIANKGKAGSSSYNVNIFNFPFYLISFSNGAPEDGKDGIIVVLELPLNSLFVDVQNIYFDRAKLGF